MNTSISSGSIQVLSSDKHYSPFVCNLCHNLVSLDAVVTIRCSHPFCRSCLEAWAAQVYKESGSGSGTSRGRRGSGNRGGGNSSSNRNAATATTAAASGLLVCPCPDCCVDLSCDPSIECMELARTMLAARPLQEAQPLAHAVLRQVQVACTTTSSSASNKQCGWCGDYGDYLAHAACHGARNGTNNNNSRAQAMIPFRKSSSSIQQQQQQQQQSSSPGVNAAGSNSPMARDKRPMFPKMLSLPSIFSKDSNTVKYDKASSLSGDSSSFTLEPRPSQAQQQQQQQQQHFLQQQQQQQQQQQSHNPANFKKSQSLRNVNNNGGSSLPPMTPIRANLDDASSEPISINPKSPRRWETNTTSIPQVQIPDNNNNKGDVPPNMVKRSRSLQSASASSSEEENKKPSRQGSSTADNNNNSSKKGMFSGGNNNNNKRSVMTKRGSKPPPATLEHEDSISDLGNSQQYMDWNTSINSLQGWNNSFSDFNHRPSEVMETLDEFGESCEIQHTDSFNAKDQQQQQEEHDEEKIARVLEQAGKLKKQANAKFNKGDFNAARSLYTEGINAMMRISRIGPEERELLSNMYSNRAVTFFREKKFEKCIQDCDLAIKHDPEYEKSWIRKWRALMAQGRLEVAFSLLELGAETIPDSRKIQQELVKARAEMDLLTKARQMVEQGEFQKVHDLLKSQTRMSDNLGILHVSARADAGLGLVETALEKANKALRFNPSQPDGLALRGYVLFVSGETEKGTHLLQDAYGRDKENKKIKQELQRLHKTHSAFNKGRSCVKRGRYSEAVDHFSATMREVQPLPKKVPLFGMLRVERAEALMLSGKFHDALQDCQDVINAQKENAMAWTVRAEVLIALGRAEEAQKQLTTIRKTWGADNPTIEEGYRRVDFELRVLKADTELMAFVKELEQGNIGGGGGGGGGGGAKVVEQDRRPSVPPPEQDRRPSVEKSGQGHRKSSADSRRSEKRGDRASSRSARPPPGPDKRRPDDQRRSLNGRAKSSRNMMGGSGGGGDSRDSRQKRRPNGLERKSMSERGLGKNRRPSSAKRT